MTFALIALAAIAGNGLGAWNIRTITQSRYAATAVLTFLSAMIGGTVGRYNAQHEWSGVLAWALGSVIGIVGMTWLDTTLLKRKA